MFVCFWQSIGQKTGQFWDRFPRFFKSERVKVVRGATKEAWVSDAITGCRV
jgi:hypothetical protein